jgi:hypothetical protein
MLYFQNILVLEIMKNVRELGQSKATGEPF